MGTNTGNRPGGRLRERAVGPACAVLAFCVAAAGLLAGPSAGWRAALPMTVAVLGVLAVASLRTRRRTVPVTAAVVAASSALGTLFGAPPVLERPTGVATLVEIAGLLLLVCLVARYAETRQAFVLCTVLGVLASTALLRLQIPPTAMQVATQSAFFALGAVAAAAAGGGLRALETRRIRAVHEARRSQRLQLAGDLHDFVAHDVSGIVVLAQAAQVIGADRPEKVLPLLQQIEASGVQALGSLDRTVHMLRSPDGTGPAGRGTADASQPSAYGLADIVDVVDRFRKTGGRAEVRLDIERSPERIGRVPREVAGTAHRVVVEALTNVRRHAGTTPWVTVSVELGPELPEPVLTVSVTNGPPSAGEAGGRRIGDRGRSGATGLEGLAERARALGGTLDFGVHEKHGWRVTAILPLS
ncbi:sensor histidine kinase [Streptomyces durocortorensis]|uniref:histidine kinase n=1 Tax=Streptomyces durocortorensis TaxID=2811104 RepID=A0ABS2HTA7_9ACTN|nr:histidine kinase [Streptomyces durocortorensis]MBM7053593.1 two-component sensor histidine kinase [Streptomyces durocortorensis]